MNAAFSAADSATTLLSLNGRMVFVKSARDHRNPPTAMRGWLEVHDAPDATPEIAIAVEFPQMFRTVAHRRTIPLDRATLTRLLESEHDGMFEFTIDDELV